ncbi:ATP-binding protein [Actinokineospora enzanensis]|uniref:ATP-binding protein n=1 Tax=Actinokineospora enzanensis TaxID=155975 RepID=UPI000A052941|nr:ATP-binding protein [Actinokineospora enzanensis]
MDWPQDRRAGVGRRRSDRSELPDLLHDLGHGLATLALLTESVRGAAELRPDTLTRVGLIEEQLARLLALLRETPAIAPVDVRALLTQLVSVASAAGAPVTLAPGDPVVTPVDARLLWRVVTNLVDNAVRAGGTVHVHAFPGPPATIEVVDTGPGFGAGPPGVAGRGLAIVDSLVRTLGGTVRITGELPAGTRIRVTLGVVEPAEDTPEAR